MTKNIEILPLDNDTINTITLDKLSIPPYLTANLTSGPYPSLNAGTYGPGSSGSYYTTNGTSGANWATITNSNKQSSLQVHGDAEFEGKVMINKQDLGEFMETISKRLAILVPDPEKLEHFEALKKAYNHYKMLEKLCELPKEEKE